MNPSQPSWIFDSLGGGMADGPNASPTVEFRGNPAYYIAREAIQNIMDAHDPKASNAVTAEFRVTTMPAKDLPGSEQMLEVLSACATYVREKGSTDTATEFETGAKKILDNRKVKVLRITDHNTVGMNSDNWFRFAESVGFSNKAPGSGGSFGLGKGAYYASSGIFSLFISSVSIENPYIFAGKSIVTTFRKDGDRKQNNGTYGVGNQAPIHDRNVIPESFTKHFPEVFQRDKPGTDFLIPDFIGEDNWDSELIQSILRYFWLPILTGRLTVKIQDGTVMDSSSVERLLHKYFGAAPFEWSNTDAPNPLPMYYAYRKAPLIRENLRNLGEVSLYLLQGDGYPNRVALIRKPGMVVDCIKKNSMNRYSAVFICENDEGNSLLREMENQEHNEWKWENAKTTQRREKAKTAYVELEEFIKQQLQKISISKEQRYLSIEGLEDFISIDVDEGTGGLNAENDPELKEFGDEVTSESMSALDLKTKKKILSIKERATANPVVYIPRTKHKKGTKRRGKSVENAKEIPGILFLSFAAQDAEGNPTHLIQIIGEANQKLDILQIVAGGDDASETILLKEARVLGDENSTFQIDRNEIRHISLDEAGKRTLEVSFTEAGKYSLRLNAFNLVKGKI